jgi:hypothetical protein
MNLREVLEAAALGLDDVSAATDEVGALTWSRRGRAFAALSAEGSVASFGLDPAVAAAAIRTPDTTDSPRGAGWVDFAPVQLDDHAADRAEAWFKPAHRRLAPRD